METSFVTNNTTRDETELNGNEMEFSFVNEPGNAAVSDSETSEDEESDEEDDMETVLNYYYGTDSARHDIQQEQEYDALNLATISPIGDVLFGTQATDDEESMVDLATHIRGIIDDSIPEEEG
ncbi:hypothetical protein A0J61_11099, partial [Choanephora cucurbitarum]